MGQASAVFGLSSSSSSYFPGSYLLAFLPHVLLISLQLLQHRSCPDNDEAWPFVPSEVSIRHEYFRRTTLSSATLLRRHARCNTAVVACRPNRGPLAFKADWISTTPGRRRRMGDGSCSFLTLVTETKNSCLKASSGSNTSIWTVC